MMYVTLGLLIAFIFLIVMLVRMAKDDQRGETAKEVIKDVEATNKAVSGVDGLRDDDVLAKLRTKWQRK